MITVKPALEAIKSNNKTGLALAGGGPLGGFYELGALCALQDSIETLDLTDLDVYVGVSVGSFLAAGLANDMDVQEMAEIFAFNSRAETPFNPDNFLRPAFREYIRNLAQTPGLVSRGLLKWAQNPLKTSIVDLLETAGRALPTGIFNNDKLEAFLRQLFTRPGRTNDFRKLKKRLYMIASELNTGQIAAFSNDSNNDVPISRAAQASSALPGLYPPVEINDRVFVDGALRRTMNASAALNEGIHLLFAVNPIVPYKASDSDETIQNLVDGGLPMVLSQTFRSIVQSRLKSGLDKYDAMYPQADIILVEPDSNDSTMFNTNLFSYSRRAELCEYAFQLTRKHLRKNASQVNPVLERHGYTLSKSTLDNKKRSIKHFIDQKEQRSNSIRQMNRSLDRLERNLRNL
ncbi:patatin-like phospholipase family protein [Marinicella sp. W31]|uniref:patatin-like phospholipase family protein n=1 Tax=Marinicella sp. W31 TaxID=3023713 RepID=UPI0037579DBB